MHYKHTCCLVTLGSCLRHLPQRQVRVSTALALFLLRALLAQTHAFCCFCLSAPHRVQPLLDTMTLQAGEASQQRLEEEWPACFE